jgi:hypothetical protein
LLARAVVTLEWHKNLKLTSPGELLGFEQLILTEKDGFVHGDHPLVYDILYESWDHVPNYRANFGN